jgi:hypothetical protein
MIFIRNCILEQYAVSGQSKNYSSGDVYYADYIFAPALHPNIMPNEDIIKVTIPVVMAGDKNSRCPTESFVYRALHVQAEP